MAKRRAQKTERVEAETVNSVESVEVDPVNLRALVDDVITDYCIRDDLDESDIPPQIWNDIIEEIRITLFEKNGNLLWINGSIGGNLQRNNNIHFQPIWYKEKIDASSQKVRRIGIQNIKQQIYDYIAVEAMKDFLKRIGEYQCAALKGRGQSYGIKAIKRWMRNKNIRYAGQCDISKCYPSIDRNKL